MTGSVLILGANGRFGRNAAEAFWNAGWHVTQFDRSRDDLTLASRGRDVIVNAWNPQYPDWREQLPKLTKQVITAAKASGATVIIPGNVFVFGADAPAVFDVATPHRATNLLGQLRTNMEQAYRAAGVKTIVLRAGDFLDTEASGNWFDKIMAPSLRKSVLTYPGALDMPHAWAFLPDMARAAVALADRRATLPQFVDIPYAGYTLTGAEMAALCADVLGKPIQPRSMNWLPLQIARPFWPLAQHLLEMRYLWDKPHKIARDSFDRMLPHFVETDPVEAMRQALAPIYQSARSNQTRRCGPAFGSGGMI